MYRNVKRLFSFILAMTIVFTTTLYFPISVFADENSNSTENSNGIELIEPNGDGSTEYPFEISTPEHLYWFANYVNNGNTAANAILTNDIVVNSNILDANGNLNNGDFIPWTPIGFANAKTGEICSFSGSFDGQNHSISGLYINDNEGVTAGLFGISQGNISNVTITDSYFYCSNYTAGICALNGTDENLTATKEGTISNCHNEATVSGICSGGICASNIANIENSHNTGLIIGSSNAGGICENNSGNIISCYNTGVISGTNTVGSICSTNAGILKNCYYLDTTAETGIGEDNNSGEVLVKSSLEFENGTVCQLLHYHTYQNNICSLCGKDINEKPEFNEEEITTVYEISTAEQLIWFSNYVNKGNFSANAVLTNDIIINSNVLDTQGNKNSGDFTKWIPIGSKNEYNGTFDGQNHTISGIVCDRNYDDSLFGTIGTEGKVSNIIISDSFISNGICYKNYGKIINCSNMSIAYKTTSSSSVMLSGICDENNGLIDNCQNHCTYNVNVSASSSGITGIVVGGICVYNSGTVKDCQNFGDISTTLNSKNISGSYIGGIVGICQTTDSETNIIVENCSNFGMLNSIGKTAVVGGICAISFKSDSTIDKINNCYNVGKLNATSNSTSSTSTIEIGGICADNSIIVSNCYNIGEINCQTGSSDTITFIGYICGNDKGTVKNNYYLEQTSGEGTEINGESAISKTKEQFMNGEVAYLLEDAQEDVQNNIWGQKIGTDDYPVIYGAEVYKAKKYEGCEGNPGNYIEIYTNDSNQPIYNDHNFSQGGICKNCGALENGKDGFKSASITLTDGIIINYFVILTDEAMSDVNAYIQFTSNQGLNKKVMLSEGIESDGRYKFSLDIRPDQMNEEITAQIVYGDNTLGSCVVYSVKEYADKVAETDTSRNLVDAMLNFGAFTQLYTGSNENDLVVDVVDYTNNAVIDKKYNYKINNNISSINVKSATLQIGANTTIKIKYQLADGADINNYTFKCGNTVLTPEKSGDYYFIYLRNIAPQNLDEMYTFSVSDGENTTTLEYGAFSYMKNILDNSQNYDKKIVNLMNAMYYYNQAANAYNI